MPKADPAAVIPPAAVKCPACGGGLVRCESGWACPAGLDHVRILSDETIARRIRPPRRKPAAMSPHQWGWYRSRPAAWAARIVRELRAGRRTPAQAPPQSVEPTNP